MIDTTDRLSREELGRADIDKDLLLVGTGQEMGSFGFSRGVLIQTNTMDIPGHRVAVCVGVEVWSISGLRAGEEGFHYSVAANFQKPPTN